MVNELQIHLFPCLSDNYGFLIHDPASGRTTCIDTPDADEIARQCDLKGWTLTDIWNTHWHPDHTGGNLALKSRYDLTIAGPGKIEGRIPGLDVSLSEGDHISLGDHEADIFETPGHTDEHIIYHMPSAHEGQGAAFVGDTIFVMGCGRLFEGTPSQMWDSLSKILALPRETRLYCAHEYTLSNAKFAIAVEPENEAVQNAITAAKARRERGEPTVPTTVAAERNTNPFWLAGNATAMGERRALKDSGAF